MVTIRGGFETSSVDPNQRTKPLKVRKTQNTATSPMILDPSAKDSTAAIANDPAAQSSQESPGLPEQQSNEHERENSGEPNDANGILDADVDADGEIINAETHVLEDSATHVSGQDAMKSWSTVNVTIPLGSTEPPPGPGIPRDISHSSKKRDLALSKSRHLSKAPRPAKLRKTNSAKDGSSVMHPKRFIHAPKAGETQC